MTPLRRFVARLTPFLLVGACSELIGLSDYETGEEPDEGEGGEATGGTGNRGGGGTAGGDTGGTAGAGRGGSAGKGGRGGTSGADPGGEAGTGGEGDAGGEGGSTAGKGGRGGSAGAGNASGMGGAGTSGVGGAGASGAAGTGGSPPCTEVVVGGLADLQIDRGASPHLVSYVFNITPAIGLSSSPDYLEVQFWNGGSFDGILTGTFPLSTGRDSNNSTCARCFFGHQDDTSPVGLQKTYFQTTGTLTVATTSQQMDGFPSISYSNVTLREATIDPNDGHSTIVPGGQCLHITSGSYTLAPTWNCEPAWQTDLDCDCGCGVRDTRCPGPEDSYCEYCWCDDSGYCTGMESSTSNWMCL